MKKSNLAIGLSFVVALASVQAHAETEEQYIGMGATAAGTTTLDKSTSEQYQNFQDTPTSTAYQGPTGASNTGGGSGGSAMGAMAKQLMVVGGGIAAAKILTPKCSAIPSAPWACPMVAMSLLQAAMSGGSSGTSKQSASQFSTSKPGDFSTGIDPETGLPRGPTTLGGATGGTTGGGPGTNGQTPQQLAINAQLGQLAGEYNDLKAQLDRSGYSISPDGQYVTGPDGKKIPVSAYSSPEGMKAAGFSDAQIEAMMNAQKAANAAANNKIRGIAMAVEGGAGGGAGYTAPTGGTGAGGGGRYGGGFNFRMPRAGGSQPKVSGLSKQLGNDKIGLASDDIFEMIHIRYDARDKAGNFVSEK